MIVRDWVDQARETLGGGVVEQVNRLDQAFTPGDTTITTEFDTEGIARGIPLCVGLNTFMVWVVNPQNKEVTVQPGWGSSPIVAADAGELVRVRPNVQTHRIFNAINDTLAELSSPLMGLYAISTHDFTYDPAVPNYDLTGAENIDRVLAVQVGDPDADDSRWVTLRNIDQWEERVTPPTAEVPSGHQLRLFGPMLTEGRTVRVVYRSGFGQVDSLDDDVSNTGLPDTALDLPVWGAAARLSVPGEWRRSLLNAQPDPRRADEVPPGAVLGGSRALQGKYMERVAQEAARLISQNPYRLA